MHILIRPNDKMVMYRKQSCITFTTLLQHVKLITNFDFRFGFDIFILISVSFSISLSDPTRLNQRACWQHDLWCARIQTAVTCSRAVFFSSVVNTIFEKNCSSSTFYFHVSIFLVIASKLQAWSWKIQFHVVC